MTSHENAQYMVEKSLEEGGRDKRVRPGNKAMATHYVDVHAVQGEVEF